MPVLISPSTEKVTTKVRCNMKLPHQINKYFKSLRRYHHSGPYVLTPFSGNNQSDSVTMQYLSQSHGLLKKHHTI